MAKLPNSTYRKILRFHTTEVRQQDLHLKVVHVPGKNFDKQLVFTKSAPGVQMKRTMERSGYINLGERSKGQ